MSILTLLVTLFEIDFYGHHLSFVYFSPNHYEINEVRKLEERVTNQFQFIY